MAAGCAIVPSYTPPVREVIRHRENGLLTDIFDSAALVNNVANVLERSAEFSQLRGNARADVVGRIDLQSQCLPRWLDLLTNCS